MQLTPANGPACPNCGCKDVEIVREPKPPIEDQLPRKDGIKGSWWAGGMAICQYCFNDFHFGDRGESGLTPTPDLTLTPDLTPAPDLLPNPNPPVSPPVSTLPPLTTLRPQIDSIRAIVCPDCGSADVRVTSTQKRVRYYRCKVCPRRFKMPRQPIRKIQEQC